MKYIISRFNHDLAFFPELRFELTNGRTLCKLCHMKTDTWGRHKK